MKVDIYGAEWCVYCKQAVKLCEGKAVQFEYIDIEQGDNLAQMEQRMGGKVKSIPQIFLDNEYVPGGFTGLKQKLG